MSQHDNKVETGTPLAPPPPMVRIDRSRRRLVGGVAGGTGVLFAVSAKTALGSTVCQSPSAAISGNTSPRPGQSAPCSGGRSPGFWKQPQHFPYWRDAAYPTFKPGITIQPCASGMQGVSRSDVLTQGTLASSILPGAPANVGMWTIIAFPAEFTGGQLMRHLLCAWLNAAYFEDYPVTKAQVTEMWNAVKAGGTYCPSSLLNCGANGWSASKVIAYIEGMYDFNAELEVNLCKKA